MHCFARKFCLGIVFMTCAVVGGATQASSPDRFENATARVSVTRPAGWQTASLQQVQANREGVRLADRELQEAIQKLAS
jgi:hypothetical protein